MNDGLDLTSFTLAGLAHRCARETELFYQGLEEDERYCFELFRRALVVRSQQAWELVYKQYSAQVAAWIRRLEIFSVVERREGLGIDPFVNTAFDNFWRAFSRDRQKLESFKGLKPLLAYLKMCCYTAVKDYLERRMDQSLPLDLEKLGRVKEEDANPEKTAEARNRTRFIEQCLFERVNSEEERIIARAYFIYDMKPQEIYKAHKEAFADVDQVRRTKDNFLARLRRDDQLLALLQVNA